MPFRKSYRENIFIEAQGYTVDHNIILQDNKSTIFLSTNGKFPRSRKTKHIKNYFLLVKDRIEKGDLEIQYGPTGHTWSDVLKKHKQGKEFRHFCRQFMNVPEDYNDEVEHLNTHPDLLPPADDDSKLLVSDSVIIHIYLRTIKKNVSFTETVPTITIGTKATTQRVLKWFSTPQNHHRNVLGKHGPMTPHTSKLDGVRTQDLVEVDLAGACT